MKRLISYAFAVMAVASSLAQAQTNIGVSIGINQPGVYGRIDIGNYPAPVPVYAEPIIVRRAPRNVQLQPIYLYVPPSQQRNWARHCGAYGACGQPVYFVQESWVRERYDSDRREHGDRGNHGNRGHDRGGDHRGDRHGGNNEHD